MGKSLADFEKTLTELEAILEQMSAPETTLDVSIGLYAKAAELIQKSNAMLENASIRIQEIDERLKSPEAAI